MTDDVHCTRHAAERFVERIDPTLSLEQASTRILTSAPAIRVAAAFGCKTVIRGDGAKLVLDGTRVLTVITTEQFARESFPATTRSSRRIARRAAAAEREA